MVFDKSAFYLGSLCYKQHAWEDTKKSLRNIKNNKCIKCIQEYNENYSKTHKEKKHLYYKKHKEIKQLYFLEYNSKETTKIYKLQWYKNNKFKIKMKKEQPEEKEKTKIYNKIWNEKNQEKVKEYNKLLEVKIRKNKWQQEKYKKDSQYRLSIIIKSSIWKYLRYHKKNQHYENVLGWKVEELEKKLKIEQPKLWKEFQNKTEKIEIDHVIPLTWFTFIFYNNLEFKLAFNLKNHRLEEKQKNISKSNYFAGSSIKPTITYDEFKDLLNYYSISLLCNVIWNTFYGKELTYN
jgi:hypothetical protein